MSDSMSPKPIDPNQLLEQIDRHWHPHVIGGFNGQEIKLAKLKGAFTWHQHPDTDEVFIVLSGQLRMCFRNHEVSLGPGQMICIPKGVEHLPVADEEVCVLLLEQAGTLNTGDVENEFTVHKPPAL